MASLPLQSHRREDRVTCSLSVRERGVIGVGCGTEECDEWVSGWVGKRGVSESERMSE